ncbi:MAG: hypothetical protein U0165_10325 [Polyangiaceae bacterium]
MIERLERSIDRIAAQRHASVSRLYWYTDLDKAQEAAKGRGRPILSLRLLGRLDEELSCANSRFFRVALYANERLSHYLQNHFVLHWSSERPAPKITIDYGDGRTLIRTITGNSIHYVLSPDAHPIDALPGLYGPWAFQRHLQEIEFAGVLSLGPDAERVANNSRAAHERLISNLEAQWASEYGAVGGNPQLIRTGVNAPSSTATPGAYDAMSGAVTKSFVETPLLRAVLPSPGSVAVDSLPWAELAKYHREEARLDARSRSLMRSKNPFDWSVNGEPKPMSDETFAKVVEGFENLMAIESARNEFLFHATLHRWFVDASSTRELRGLNQRVYAELFKTPASDPWLGLVPTDSFSALDNDGLHK